MSKVNNYYARLNNKDPNDIRYLFKRIERDNNTSYYYGEVLGLINPIKSNLIGKFLSPNKDNCRKLSIEEIVKYKLLGYL